MNPCDWCERPGARMFEHRDPWGRVVRWFECQKCRRLLRELENAQ